MPRVRGRVIEIEIGSRSHCWFPSRAWLKASVLRESPKNNCKKQLSVALRRKSPRFEAFLSGNAYRISTLSRHSASKVSELFSARACESNGLPRFSVTTLAASRLDAGCADASLGHSSNDFESMGLPSYQHFRPSIRR